jgi:biotin carboxyl carrier protein
MMSVGQKVSIGEVLLIQESMKLELTIESTDNGKIIWLASAGTSVQADDPVAIIETGE